MSKALLGFAIIMMVVVFTLGCSGASNDPTTIPDTITPQLNPGDTGNNHLLWGVWDIYFDTANLDAVAIPVREPQGHFDITQMLMPPSCLDCLKLKTNSFNPGTGILDVDVTIKNPSQLNAYDVRGIMFTTDEGHLIVNPDNWTSLHDVPGGYDINPFRAYAKGEPARVFGPGSVETENFQIQVPKPPQFQKIRYCVDVSWPGNCKEPYSIFDFTQGTITNEIGSHAMVGVNVADWQDDVSSVRLYAQDVTGQEYVELANTSGDVWQVDLTNTTGAGPGDLQIVIEAKSDVPINLALSEIAMLTITEAPSNGWARAWGGGGSDVPHGVAVDADGNIYVDGEFSLTTDFDPGPGEDLHTSEIGYASFLCKYDPGGGYQWVRTWGETGGGISALGIAVDNNGYIYVTGHWDGTIDFDPGPGVEEHTFEGYQDAFLSKFDYDGNFIWVRVWGGDYNDHGYGVATDDNGNIYVTGIFKDLVDFDPGPGEEEHGADSGKDVFLSKFNQDGDFQWARTWGGSDDDIGWRVCVDDSGNPYVAGDFRYTVDFDTGPGVDEHSSASGSKDNGFISKFNPSGDYQWARTWGGDDENHAYDIATDGSSYVYAGGVYWGWVDFDPGTGEDLHTSSGGSELYLTKFNLDGDYQFVLAFGGPKAEWISSLAVDNLGDIYFGGWFADTVDFDPGPGVDEHTAQGSLENFICKFTSSGSHVWCESWGGVNSVTEVHSVAVDSDLNSFAVGDFWETVDLDPGPGEQPYTSGGYEDAYLLKFPPDGEW